MDSFFLRMAAAVSAGSPQVAAFWLASFRRFGFNIDTFV
jgi:hypothetical protein